MKAFQFTGCSLSRKKKLFFFQRERGRKHSRYHGKNIGRKFLSKTTSVWKSDIFSGHLCSFRIGSFRKPVRIERSTRIRPGREVLTALVPLPVHTRPHPKRFRTPHHEILQKTRSEETEETGKDPLAGRKKKKI